MIRILITDDHALIREGLRKVFGRENDIEIVAEAQTAAEAVACVREHQLDVAVLDFNLPGRSGLDALQQIRELRPQLPVLMLSMMPERGIALRAFKAGAVGFVSKESAADDIVTAVRQAAAGGKYVSPAVAQELASGIGLPADKMPHQTLSDREFQVLRMIAGGRNTRQIAEQLALSVHTVATYRRRIREKLDLDSDVEITRYAIDNDLTP